MPNVPTVCVFCGASTGLRENYRDHARQMGNAIARAGFRLVFGGGRVGLMGVIADAVLAAGGKAIGVIPRCLMDREVAHLGLTELHVVETMHQRKRMMDDLADAFLAMPGSYGTLDELCEVLGWAQLGLHSKPIVLLNIEGYWDPLFAMFDRAVEEGFMQMSSRKQAQRASSVEEAMHILQQIEQPVSVIQHDS